MKAFDHYISRYINESVIDIPRNSLDPTVWEFPEDGLPIMHPVIKTQIETDIMKIDDMVRVKDFYAIGSILTNRYSPTADIDVNVQVDPKNELEVESALDVIREVNGRLAPGTTHPINYYITTQKYDLNKTDAAYDIQNEVWIKEPNLADLNVKEYMDRFQTTINGVDLTMAELRRDIIDFEELKKFSPDEIKNLEGLIDTKLSEIEDGIESLTRSYTNARTMRMAAFDREMSPKEIRKYGKKNRLPENVVYKLLERYYYFTLFKELKKIVGEDGEIEVSDINKIKNAGKDFWK